MTKTINELEQNVDYDEAVSNMYIDLLNKIYHVLRNHFFKRSNFIIQRIAKENWKKSKISL